jgi:2'-5' RNA ligase
VISDSHLSFIDDPSHIAQLDRQRFVVLRAPAAVASVYAEVRSQVLERLQGQPISFPARAHVTLCGFAAGTSIDAVRELVREWAPALSRIPLEVERVSVFPTPFQIVIVQVRKHPALYAALADLRARAGRARLAVSTLIPVEQWTFHMSVVYGSQLSLPVWSDVAAFSQQIAVANVCEDVDRAEIIAFDNGREHCGGIVDFGHV